MIGDDRSISTAPKGGRKSAEPGHGGRWGGNQPAIGNDSFKDRDGDGENSRHWRNPYVYLCIIQKEHIILGKHDFWRAVLQYEHTPIWKHRKAGWKQFFCKNWGDVNLHEIQYGLLLQIWHWHGTWNPYGRVCLKMGSPWEAPQNCIVWLNIISPIEIVTLYVSYMIYIYIYYMIYIWYIYDINNIWYNLYDIYI